MESRRLPRALFHVRYMVMFCVALKYYQPRQNDLLSLYLEMMGDDLLYCQNCFEAQKEQCQRFFENLNNNYYIKQSLLFRMLELWPKKWRRREIQWLVSKDNHDQSVNLLYKYKGQRKYELQGRANSFCLKNSMTKCESLSGSLQYCRLEDRISFGDDLFLDSLQTAPFFNKISVDLYSIVNIEPILMPILRAHNFSVPKTLGTCGFSVIQQDAGKPLSEYQSAAFPIKLKIALQLIEASIQFTYGFIDKYHLYVTDLTARNVLYDELTAQLHFIDLDSVFLVKSVLLNKQSPPAMHRYENIDCPGCLAFIPDDLCLQDISDMNIYIVCRFLSADLFQEVVGGQGFLHPWPSDFQAVQLRLILQKCINCPLNECTNRLNMVESLLSTIRQMLHSNQSTEYRN